MTTSWTCSAVITGSAGRPDRAALLVPGSERFHQSLLTFAYVAVARRESHLHTIWWDRPDRPLEELFGWAADQTRFALDGLRAERPAATTPLVVGKSLGTGAASVAAELGLPAIWLTPVLTDATVVAGLERATAPFLLVGGTGDRLWDGALALTLTPHVLEVPDADHGMFVPGPLAASGTAHGAVGTAIERFLDEVVWPVPAGHR